MTPRRPPCSTEVLISAAEIAGRVSSLAETIAAKLPADMMIVSLLRGSFVFTADLIRALHLTGAHPQVDFITLASYGAKTVSSGEITIVRDLTETVEGRDVLIVDDILESGRTLHFARQLVAERNARSIQIAVLLEKPGKRAVDIHADFVGFVIPDRFVVGYGLDYANYYRELPYIGAVESV
ncbi:MAG: hypoxanthine phosphoribosyltransferase [Pseudomonadota bacterium]|nr:hypoxanthine phosphoribosyltransferase [Pseudomonadota bacterium]